MDISERAYYTREYVERPHLKRQFIIDTSSLPAKCGGGCAIHEHSMVIPSSLPELNDPTRFFSTPGIINTKIAFMKWLSIRMPAIPSFVWQPTCDLLGIDRAYRYKSPYCELAWCRITNSPDDVHTNDPLSGVGCRMHVIWPVEVGSEKSSL